MIATPQDLQLCAWIHQKIITICYDIELVQLSSGYDWKYAFYSIRIGVLLVQRSFEQGYSSWRCYQADMEIMESIMWVGLGFIPTLATLEFVSKRSQVGLRKHPIGAGARLKEVSA